MANEAAGEQMVQKLANYAIDGVWKLSGAKELAGEYLQNPKYGSLDERIDALIRWETGKNATTGFVTGLGGLLTLPIAVPAALGSSWVIQARLSAAIAHMSGYDIHSDQVRSMVVWCLLGDSMKEVLKHTTVQLGTKSAQAALRNVSGRALIEINKRVGFRLITKAGEKGVINLAKGIPVLGGVLGGTVDAVSTRAVGKFARQLFPPINGVRA